MSPLRLGPAITGPLAQIHDGAGELSRRYGRWLWPAEDPTIRRLLLRLAGSGVIVYLGATVVTDSPGWMWPASIGGAVAAYRAGKPGTGPTDGEQPGTAAEDVTETDDDQPEDGPDDAEFIALVRDLIGPDGKGIHLAEIPAALTREWPHRQWDAADARALAQRAGLPIHSTRSPNRNGPSTGIRRKDLPPPPLPEEALVGVVGAGQTSDNDNDNTRVERIGEGGAVTRYPAETAARHHDIRRAS